MVSDALKRTQREAAQRLADDAYNVEDGFERGIYKRTRYDAVIDELFVRIAKAAPFMDEGCPANKWPPSVKLRIAYCALATGITSQRKAAIFVDSMLDRARRLWIEGLNPDPWAQEPKVRLSVRAQGDV